MAKQGKDLFEVSTEAQLRQDAPLAARMRPLNFDEYVGQEHLIGKGRALRTSIEADRLPSMVLWGPPGSGKTTLARIIASQTQASFKQVSAVASGVAELRQVIKEAKDIPRHVIAAAPYCSSTKSTASTRLSRTWYCPMSRMGPSP